MMKTNLLSTAEAAEYLGIKLSYLHKLMMQKAICFYKPNGKLCYFDPEDLDRWLRRTRIVSDDEVDQQASAYITRHDTKSRK